MRVAIEKDFEIRPVSSILGAEVIGLDVSSPLNADQFERVWQAFRDYHLLVFRDQSLSPEEQVAFSKQFGELEIFPDRDNRRSLYFTTNAGNEISGISLKEGQALHRELAEFVSQPQFCYKHRWSLHDLVMWDNRCLLHRARAYDMDKYRRFFRRTTVGGQGPIIGPFSRIN